MDKAGKEKIKISCIIPAYNEAGRIKAVLDVVVNHPLIGEIIVVDDASTDATRQVIEQFSNITLIVHPENKGKSHAIHTGVNQARGEYLLFLDSDLIGLTEQAVTDLITPVLEGHADKSISLRRNAPRFWHKIGLDYISGERVFPKKLLEGRLDDILSLPGFGLEVFFNSLAIEKNYTLKVVHWENVESPYKEVKYGWWKGVKGDIKMGWDIVRTVTLLGPLKQIMRMLKMRVHHPPYKISFVVPAYNEEEYIAGCIESILKEVKKYRYTYEIIVVNNASTDKTAEIATSFPDVKVVSEPRKGLSQARQAGFKVSTGDLIANIDADTRLSKGWLDKVMRTFQNDPDLVALSGPYVYYDVEPKVNKQVERFYRLGQAAYVVNKHIFRVGSMLQGGNFIVRRPALEQIGGFDVRYSFYGEDTDIARRMHGVGKVKFTFELPAYSSGRRLKKEGMLVMAFRYGINYIWTTFFKRPYTKTVTDISKK